MPDFKPKSLEEQKQAEKEFLDDLISKMKSGKLWFFRDPMKLKGEGDITRDGEDSLEGKFLDYLRTGGLIETDNLVSFFRQLIEVDPWGKSFLGDFIRTEDFHSLFSDEEVREKVKKQLSELVE